MEVFYRQPGDGQKQVRLELGDDNALVVMGRNSVSFSERPFPYSDVRLLPYLQHSFWFLPNVAACHAMARLLAEKHNTFWHEYEVVVAAGASAGIGIDALPPVRKVIGSGFETKTITLSCGKLTTGVTVQQKEAKLEYRRGASPKRRQRVSIGAGSRLLIRHKWKSSGPRGWVPLRLRND